MAADLTLVKKKPRRITVSLPEALVVRLENRADFEGRSVSNLAAYLLERALDNSVNDHSHQRREGLGQSQATP